jgi:hypothetical protein
VSPSTVSRLGLSNIDIAVGMGQGGNGSGGLCVADAATRRVGSPRVAAVLFSNLSRAANITHTPRTSCFSREWQMINDLDGRFLRGTKRGMIRPAGALYPMFETGVGPTVRIWPRRPVTTSSCRPRQQLHPQARRRPLVTHEITTAKQRQCGGGDIANGRPDDTLL